MPDRIFQGISVLVVDDHPVVRHGLSAVLTAESWVSRVLEAGTLAEGRRQATVERPEVAVVDLGLPDGDGTDLIRQLATIAPQCAVVVLTMTKDPGTVRMALDAGARGYLLKDAAPDVVIGVLRTVAAGGRALGPRVDAEPAGGGRPAGPLAALTPRERRLLMLVGQGCSNAEIAARLAVSEKTVRNQVSMLITKLGVADRVQAALLGQHIGLTD